MQNGRSVLPVAAPLLLHFPHHLILYAGTLGKGNGGQMSSAGRMKNTGTAPVHPEAGSCGSPRPFSLTRGLPGLRINELCYFRQNILLLSIESVDFFYICMAGDIPRGTSRVICDGENRLIRVDGYVADSAFPLVRRPHPVAFLELELPLVRPDFDF